MAAPGSSSALDAELQQLVGQTLAQYKGDALTGDESVFVESLYGAVSDGAVSADDVEKIASAALAAAGAGAGVAICSAVPGGVAFTPLCGAIGSNLAAALGDVLFGAPEGLTLQERADLLKAQGQKVLVALLPKVAGDPQAESKLRASVAWYFGTGVTQETAATATAAGCGGQYNPYALSTPQEQANCYAKRFKLDVGPGSPADMDLIEWRLQASQCGPFPDPFCLQKLDSKEFFARMRLVDRVKPLMEQAFRDEIRDTLTAARVKREAAALRTMETMAQRLTDAYAPLCQGDADCVVLLRAKARQAARDLMRAGRGLSNKVPTRILEDTKAELRALAKQGGTIATTARETKKTSRETKAAKSSGPSAWWLLLLLPPAAAGAAAGVRKAQGKPAIPPSWKRKLGLK